MKHNKIKGYFVVGDIHGCYSELRLLLDNHWNPESETLVFLGDLVDRGPESYKVITYIMELKNKYDVVVIGGNHDELFIEWLESPEDGGYYYDIGGRETIDSFFGNRLSFELLPSVLAEKLKSDFPEIIKFLKELPSFFETEKFIFVHAGINLDLKNWSNSTDKVFKWIRKPFIYGKNDTGKKVVFGHTPTRNMNEDGSDDVWFSPCGTKIGIDGACVYGGYLHALKIKDNFIDKYSIKKTSN